MCAYALHGSRRAKLNVSAGRIHSIHMPSMMCVLSVVGPRSFSHLGPDRQLPRDVPTSNMEPRSPTSKFNVRCSNIELRSRSWDFNVRSSGSNIEVRSRSLDFNVESSGSNMEFQSPTSIIDVPSPPSLPPSPVTHCLV